jgi:DNA-binding SARP family transcriptional activator
MAGAEGFSAAVERVGTQAPAVLSIAAEPILVRIEELRASALTSLLEEAGRRPDRWLESARRELSTGTPEHRHAVSVLLEQIGQADDVDRLRDAARLTKDRRIAGFSRALARRLAPRVMVEDLGRVRVTIGSQIVEGSEIRRKVLALLCLLLTLPRFAGTREEVLEHLWPELDPASALNSLNQTTYFLRRVFEPDYREDVSPRYLHQDSETIWLDQELIDSRSSHCRAYIRAVTGVPTPEQASALATEYRGKFALDFAYEEWASTYRDQLHASYLRVIEHAVRLDIESGNFARGTLLAERAAEVEPESDDLQLALVRLYRLSGAHAAAAEQYGHYAQSLRGIGVEPPAFGDV